MSNKSTEVLTHFNCGSCTKWWSISEAEPDRNYFCPWCSYLNVYFTQADEDVLRRDWDTPEEDKAWKDL